MSTVQWNPSTEMIANTRLYKWMKKLGFTDYNQFYKRSITDSEWFWKEAEKELAIPWYEPYDRVLDDSHGIEWPKWFAKGKLNAYNMSIEKWVNDPEQKNNEALIWEGEDGEKRTYTFTTLAGEINRVAAGLEKLAIKRGDVVALYMPMIPETVIAMMAVAKIGAIFTPIFSGYGTEAIATRINASDAKLVITADGFQRKGKAVYMKKQLDDALNSCPEVKKVVVVNRLDSLAIEGTQDELSWNDLISNESLSETEQMNSDDPLMLIYTSGTTGKPKGTVHTHSGFPIKAAFDAGIGMDVQQGDTLCWYTDMGWMMGPFLVYAGLINGAKIVLYEGSPDFPEPNRLWKLASTYQITHLGISPTLIRSLMKAGDSWIASESLSTLRVLASTGEPWTDDAWLWLFEQVGKRNIPIFNYTGGTEIAGGILGNILIRPIKPSSFNAALPGMAAFVYDDSGQSCINQVGELVLTKPWVGMTKGFWQQPKRYIKTYWSTWSETWVHGDWAIKDQSGYWKITGRSDDTINVAGKRIGPNEIESVLASHESVHEAGVIAVPDQEKGEVAVCFIVLKQSSTEELEQELLSYVSSRLGKALRPKRIHTVTELPKTKNGKIMRRVLKQAYLHKPMGDISTVENHTVLQEIANLNKTRE
ncbi:AMP-binding protein [Halalkalibacter akibai]|uniref:acetate--CoA ligase n=1 Tax=Halalkalibacter akibai (strain ATCC 43226 / DSM 21942 / CIP 109018 / JCM 9157 / 1139) TaxID=1236973 RepID=W4QVJ6_HALA3|nr:AMP-binding protein [Halalkalibacter akibai]GAE35653.1 acetoacetyl-CoA synthetase [Halalkalibacter akibai JCM 9157]